MDRSVTKLLGGDPHCVQGADWKDFIVEHPWYPKRLLVKHFHIKPYDFDNYKSRNPGFVRKYNDPRENFQKATTSDDLREALAKAWRFLFDEVLGIDCESPDAIPAILKLSGINRSPWAFLCESRVLRRIKWYEKWAADGYTQLAFIVCRVYPGPEWAERVGILPIMFSQTGRRPNRAELLRLLEHIYLKFIARLPDNPSIDALAKAKERFCIRSRENSFITTRMLARYGLTGHLARDEGIISIIDGLRGKFAAELGCVTGEPINWNPERAKKEHPHRSFNSCQYCGRKPVEIHHLLSRRDYPQLMYENENIVPLCVNIHQAITRNMISKELATRLAEAEARWKKARKGEKLQTFDDAMLHLHKEFY